MAAIKCLKSSRVAFSHDPGGFSVKLVRPSALRTRQMHFSFENWIKRYRGIIRIKISNNMTFLQGCILW
jgi:hypothetical protein